MFQDMLVDLETAGIVASGSSLLVFPILFVDDQLRVSVSSKEANSSTSSDAARPLLPYQYSYLRLQPSADRTSDKRCSSLHLIVDSKAWSSPMQEAVSRTLAATMRVRNGGLGCGYLPLPEVLQLSTIIKMINSRCLINW